MAEYWGELLTQASWEALVEISKKYGVTVIGGWAVYLWTRQHKSKDADIIADYTTLDEMRKEFQVFKNYRLRKYEIKMEKFDVDIYVPHYSKLAIPVEALKDYVDSVEGFKTVCPEALLALKQGAEIDRKGTTKGRKDAIDILTLMLYAPMDLKKYSAILKKFGLEDYLKELFRVLSEFDERDCAFLGLGFKEFADWRRKKKEELKKL